MNCIYIYIHTVYIYIHTVYIYIYVYHKQEYVSRASFVPFSVRSFLASHRQSHGDAHRGGRVVDGTGVPQRSAMGKGRVKP